MSRNTNMFKALTIHFLNEVNKWFKLGGKKRYVPILMIKNIENTGEESYCRANESCILKEKSLLNSTSLKNVKLKEEPCIFNSYKRLFFFINMGVIELKKKDTFLQKNRNAFLTDRENRLLKSKKITSYLLQNPKIIT